jgi:formamidopyrimidine-DNA glycosylase
MPELIEVEVYRQHAERALGRTMADVVAPDAWFLKGGLTASAVDGALRGRKLTSARRIGKLLLLDTDGGTGPVLGLRFGMTGRLLVDAMAPIAELEYGSMLDPDLSRLGADALSITPAQLRAALDGSTAPLKARLMDQSRVAGLGNLLTDEMLWRAGLDPARQARSLTPAEQRRLHRHVRTTLDDLTARGGSHTGDLQHARARGGRCPRDGTPLDRRTIGGRTTYSCPRHQR